MDVSLHCDRALAELQQLLNPAWAPRQAPLVVLACYGRAEADMPPRRGAEIYAEEELNRLEEEAEDADLPDVAPLTSVQVGWATDMNTGSRLTHSPVSRATSSAIDCPLHIRLPPIVPFPFPC
jgi:hypothetical protein